MFTKYVAIFVLAAGILVGADRSLRPLFGQEDAKKDKTVDRTSTDAPVKERLLQTLAKLEKSPSLRFRGTFETKYLGAKPKGKGPFFDFSLNGIKVPMDFSEEGRQPFNGKLEIWRSPNGEVAMISTEAVSGLPRLPLLAIYNNGKRRIVQTRYEADPVDVDVLLPKELSLLLFNLPKLNQCVATTADLKPLVQKNGDTAFTVPLNNSTCNSIFDQKAGAEAIFSSGENCPKPPAERAEARIVCSAQGKVKALEFHVAHSNAYSLLADALEGKSEQEKKNWARSQPKARTMIYKLSIWVGEPSKRLRDFCEAMRKELRK